MTRDSERATARYSPLFDSEPLLGAVGGAVGVGPGAAEIFGTGGAAGTLSGWAAEVPGAALGGLGKLLGGLDGVLSDFSATAVAALGGEEAPPRGGRDAPGPGSTGLGATEAALGIGFGAIEPVPGAGATEESGFGATDALDPGAAATGARKGMAPAGFETRGGAGIDVRPVAGPGPSGATGWVGIVIDGVGGASSRKDNASASKLRRVFLPQMGQSQPTSNRF